MNIINQEQLAADAQLAVLKGEDIADLYAEPAATKPLPKSLHTVTVLVRMVRYFQFETGSYSRAMARALRILGYDAGDDPHGLIAAAWRQIEPDIKADI